tara:strand:+ start:119 stop:358 length:240 start_codon:yes stop_codon:yes gene_type:complete
MKIKSPLVGRKKYDSLNDKHNKMAERESILKRDISILATKFKKIQDLCMIHSNSGPRSNGISKLGNNKFIRLVKEVVGS